MSTNKQQHHHRDGDLRRGRRRRAAEDRVEARPSRLQRLREWLRLRVTRKEFYFVLKNKLLYNYILILATHLSDIFENKSAHSVYGPR